MSMTTVKELKARIADLKDDDQLVFLLDCDRDGYTFDCHTKDGEWVFSESLDADESWGDEEVRIEHDGTPDHAWSTFER